LRGSAGREGAEGRRGNGGPGAAGAPGGRGPQGRRAGPGAAGAPRGRGPQGRGRAGPAARSGDAVGAVRLGAEPVVMETRGTQAASRPRDRAVGPAGPPHRDLGRVQRTMNGTLLTRGRSRIRSWIAVAAVTIALSLRALAIAVERHASRRAALGGPGYGLFRTALLLHRLEAPSARAARLLMYLALLLIPIYLGYSFWFFLRWPSLVARNVPLTAAAMLALVVTVVGVRAWALDLDRRGSAPVPASDGPEATQGSPP